MKKLLFVLATAVLLFLTACDGPFIDPGTMDMMGGGGIGGGGGGKKPAAPTGVTATAVSSSSIRISWNAVSGADEYNVYRSTSSSGTYSYRGYTRSTSYTDSGLSSGTTYYYRVTAENDNGESAQSSSVSATTSSSSSGSKPSAPTGVTATAQSSSSIRITWNSVSGASRYIIYRSSTASGSYSNVGYISSTSFTNTGLSADTTYYYRVSAENNNGESAQSSTVYAKTSTASGGSGDALTPENLGANGGVDWKNDAAGVEMQFDKIGSDLSCVIFSGTTEYAQGSVTISNNKMTWADGKSCNISLSSDLKTITISGFTGSGADKVNGSYRKRT
jgi:fibronectin type 3 domain-containing protein